LEINCDSVEMWGGTVANASFMSKRFVYVLKNAEVPPRYYTGLTSDVAARLTIHNTGRCTHTAKHRPWTVDFVIEFADERRAVAFERYLKSGSGVAFAQRHLR
jgi:predicted GIY-YIG superfamily endonuclease